MMANEVMDNSGGIPAHLMEDAGMGKEEVQQNTQIPELRVSTKMSRVFEDEEVKLGHIYNNDSHEDLGDARAIVVFAYRRRYQCSNENNTAIFCKSYDRETGLVRAYQEEDFDDEFKEEMQLTEEELSGEDVGIVERTCAECSFHPDNWKEVDGKNIPPRCEHSHEFYVIDVTSGMKGVENGLVDVDKNSINKHPNLVRVNKSSSLKSKFIKDFNNLLDAKLVSAPIFGGVFKLYGNQVKNSMGGKNYVFDADFVGYLPPGEVYDYVKRSHVEFERAEEENNRKAEERAAASKDDFDDEDFEDGSAFDDNVDDAWPPEA